MVRWWNHASGLISWMPMRYICTYCSCQAYPFFAFFLRLHSSSNITIITSHHHPIYSSQNLGPLFSPCFSYFRNSPQKNWYEYLFLFSPPPSLESRRLSLLSWTCTTHPPATSVRMYLPSPSAPTTIAAGSHGYTFMWERETRITFV